MILGIQKMKRATIYLVLTDGVDGSSLCIQDNPDTLTHIEIKNLHCFIRASTQSHIGVESIHCREGGEILGTLHLERLHQLVSTAAQISGKQ